MTEPLTSPAAHPLARLENLPGVRAATEAAREACTELRWHEALRRRSAECATEARVHGAWASASLEGAELPLDWVREVMVGARRWSAEPDPVESVVRGAVRATEEAAHLESLVGASPRQVLARLHVAAARGLVDDDALGRPRLEGEEVRELTDVGPAPGVDEVRARLAGLQEVLTAPASVPAVLVAAVAHAEIVAVRPFVRGNGLVARAVQRAVVRSRGLDPMGLAVVEAGHRPGGGVEYLGALAAYATGSPEGVGLWVRHVCDAVVGGARAGGRIADSVRAGRLPEL
ncbi:Fic family protein [Kytococcus sp. Marseille-QA3725]